VTARVLWTRRADADLRAIAEYLGTESPQVAMIVLARLVAAVERAAAFPRSGRQVPEFERPYLREVVVRPYRVVYRLVGEAELHVLTVHHGARLFPPEGWLEP